ncbi:MAG: serine protease, partial [Pseudomonadota bacterium]
MTKQRILLSLFLCGLVCTNLQAKTENDKIINGSAASTTTYPWITRLYVNEREIVENGQTFISSGECGGTLISPQWVLTAAHCFLDASNMAVDPAAGGRTRVLMGSDSDDTQPGLPVPAGATQAMSSRVIIHPSYNPAQGSPNSNDFDIALLELQTPITGRQTLPLLSSTAPAFTAETQFIIAGWGSTAVGPDGMGGETGINSSNTLLQAAQRFVTEAECINAYGGGITANMICANGLNASDTSDTCQGDSGGPMVLASGASFIQVGVVSFGNSCGNPQVPGVYARVSQFNDFIRQNVPDAQFVAPGGATTPTTPPTTPTTATPIDDCQATIDLASGRLTIPCVFAEGQSQYFSLALQQQAPALTFELDMTSITPVPSPSCSTTSVVGPR